MAGVSPSNDIPFEHDSLDVVIANHMLYHIDNVDGVLKSVSNILKTGGKLYAATNGESISVRWRCGNMWTLYM